jgi:hypothetical protein
VKTGVKIVYEIRLSVEKAKLKFSSECPFRS